ncbi:MAG TPA: cation diffusion facilitator family transporter [Burkholderiales bacterium]|nr:cation diffusion facilitator family transporter [Burkholderiales bacterium]
MARASLRNFALLSIAAALATIALKVLAWRLTGSVGLLSDALEGTVNLAGAIVMLVVLGIAALPPDEEHEYGYTKAEYFASGFEGMLILIAAAAIAAAAIERLLAPRPLEQVGAGLVVSAFASLINYIVARRLFKAGNDHRSIALEADAQHLMTDVWTSAGVIAGVAVAALTGWQPLDPLIALAVAAHIVWTGVRLVRRSFRGLLDQALPEADRAAVEQILARYRAQGVGFHALRTRQAGTRSFVSLHVLVPDEWTVARGHALLEKIEEEIRTMLSGAHVTTHLEPRDQPDSYHDMDLDR